MPTFSDLIRLSGPWGLYRLARRLTRRQPRILMYHRFSPQPREGYTSAATFEAQVSHIKRHYTPLTAAQLVQSLFGERSLPDNAVVITVDDGYEDFLTVAFPVLQRLEVPATLYVTTGFVDGCLWLWPDQVSWLLHHCSFVQAPVKVQHLVIPPGALDASRRAQLFGQLVAQLLDVSDRRKHELIAQLATELGLSLPEKAPQEYAALSWQQLERLQQAGIEIGGHTVTHPSLGQVDPIQAREEIQGCQEALTQHLGAAERTFCYPNGQPGDFTPGLIPEVEQAGFTGAVLAFPDAMGVRGRYAMRRHVGGEGRFQFQKSISGVEYLGQRLRRAYRIR